MRKITLLIIIISIVATGCNNIALEKNNEILLIQTTPSPSSISTPIISSLNNDVTEELVMLLKKQNHTQNISVDEVQFILVDEEYKYSDFKYLSEEYGFSITFPHYWLGSIRIAKSENKKIWFINYVGYSEESYNSIYNGLEGLTIGLILSEEETKNEELYDDTNQIGEINGEKYFFDLLQQGSLGLIDEIYWYETGESDKYDELQYELMKIDYLIFTLMENEMEEIMETFEAID